MFALTPHHRFFLYAPPCDMRKGSYGLGGLVRSELQRDPLSGEVFVFINRSRTTMKILVFETDGYLLYTKKLEAGRFQQHIFDPLQHRISYQELQHIIQGIDVRFIKKRKRFSFKKTG